MIEHSHERLRPSGTIDVVRAARPLSLGAAQQRLLARSYRDSRSDLNKPPVSLTLETSVHYLAGFVRACTSVRSVRDSASRSPRIRIVRSSSATAWPLFRR